MSKSVFSLLCTLENFILSEGKKRKKDIEKAHKLYKMLKENYSLTEKQVQWVSNLYK